MAVDTLAKKAKELELGITPTTALSANSIGATPQQSAMAGTEAAKTKVAKEQTLAGVERQALTNEAPDRSQVAQTLRAQRLAEASSSLNPVIQNALNNQINNTTANMGPSVNQTRLGTALNFTPEQLADPNSESSQKYKKASDALLAFSNAKDEASQNAALQTLIGLGIPAASAAELMNTAAEAVGSQVKVAVPTVDKLDFKDPTTGQPLIPGIDSIEGLARLLKVNARWLRSQSVTDLPNIIQDIQMRSANEVGNLQAQIASLPVGSAQRVALQKQLQDLEGAGVGTQQRKAANTIAELQTSDQIDINGQSYSAEDLLGDGQISDIMVQWLNTPDQAAKDKILDPAKYGDLIDWMTTNAGALSDLTQDLGTAATTFGTTQETITNAGGSMVAPETVAAATGITLPPNATAEQAKAYTDAFNATGLGQLVTAGNTAIVNAVEALPPDQKAIALKMNKDDLSSAYDLANTIGTDDDLAELAGVTPVNGMVLNAEDRKKVQEYKAALDLVKGSDSTAAWITESFFRKLSPTEMRTLVRYPHRYRELKEFTEDSQTVNDIGPLTIGRTGQIDPKAADRVLDAVVGADVKKEDIESAYASAVLWASRGDAEAIKRKEKFEEAFGLSEAKPKFTARMLGDLRDHMSNMVAGSSGKIVNGSQTYRKGGIDVLSYIKKTLDQGAYNPEAGSLYSTFSKELDDGALSQAEIESAVKKGNGSDLEKLISTLPNNEETLNTFSTVNKSYQEGKIQSAISDLTASMNLNTFPNFMENLGTWDGKKIADNKKSLDAVKKSLKDLSKNDPVQKAWADTQIKNIDNFINATLTAEKKVSKKKSETDAVTAASNESQRRDRARQELIEAGVLDEDADEATFSSLYNTLPKG